MIVILKRVMTTLRRLFGIPIRMFGSLWSRFAQLTARLRRPRQRTRIEHLDAQLMQRILPKRMPSFRQLAYLPRVLNRSERYRLLGALTLCVLVAVILVVRTYRYVTVAVPATGGIYIEGLVGSPRLINPLLATSETDRTIANLIYSGLMRSDGQGGVINDLATGVSVSEDQKTYTVTLRDNVRWHDDEPFSADDVVFTFQTIQDPVFKSSLRASFSGVTVQKLDRTTILFQLQEPSSSFQSLLTVGLLPEHVWYAVPASQAQLAEANTKPIGTGPFAFKDLTKDSTGGVRAMNLMRSRFSYAAAAYLDGMTFKFYPDYPTAIEALQNKNVDGLGFIPLEYGTDLSEIKGVHVLSVELPSHNALFINPEKNEALKDVKVRTALSLALDRQRIVREALNGNGQAIAAPIFPSIDPADIQQPTQDTAQASALLDEAGWKTTASSTVRMKDSKPLSVSVTAAEQPENQATLEIIRDTWNTLGVETTITLVPKQKIRKEVIETRAYQLLLYGQLTRAAVDTYAFWHSSQSRHPGSNLSLITSKDVDELVQQLRSASDPAREQELLRSLASKLTEQTAALFLYRPAYLYPISTSLKGIPDLTNVSLPSDRFVHVTEWYLKTKRHWK